MRIPAGAAHTIPSFGTGTLGYRSPISGVVGADSRRRPVRRQRRDAARGRRRRRDPATNVAPVGRAADPGDRRPLAGGDRRHPAAPLAPGPLPRPRPPPARRRSLGPASAGSGNPNPSGGDPYTLFPPDQCLVAGCAARIDPEYSFTSSDPDIADFVRQDPASTNLRKPFLDAGDKVVTDNTSGLLCPFNAGTTTVTVSAGGYSYSEQVTVLGGSVQRPCGTRPLRPDRFKRASAVAPPAGAATARSAPGGSPPVDFTPPAAAAGAAASGAAPRAAARRHRRRSRRPSCRPRSRRFAVVPAIVPPPPPPIVRPLPPGGAPARTYQVEEKREEEAATEESQAFSRYDSRDERLHRAALPAGPGPARRPRRRLGPRRPRRPPQPHPARARLHPPTTNPKESK